MLKSKINWKLVRYGSAAITVFLLVLLVISIKNRSAHTFVGIRLRDILIPLLLWIIYIFFDSLKLTFLARGISHKLSVFGSFKVISIGIFLAAVTPFQVSGLPVQVYLLTRYNISAGEGTSLLMLRGFITYSGIFLLTFPAIKMLGHIESNLMRGVVYYAVFVIFIVFFIYILAVWEPAFVSKKIKNKKLLDEIKKMQASLKLSFKDKTGRLNLSIALIFTLISLFSLSLIPYTVSKSLGLNVSMKSSISGQIFLLGTLLFTPTPGGSGIAEGASYAVFKKYMTPDKALPFVLLWRFFTFYITAVVGGILLIFELRKE